MSTNSVVVLIPPPVEAGLAPINISAIVTVLDTGESSPTPNDANPAVLVEAEKKNAFASLFPKLIFPNVMGLLYSKIM